MKLSRIIYRFHTNIIIPDEQFIKLLTVVLGDLKSYQRNSDNFLILNFEEVAIYLCTSQNFKNLISMQDKWIDLKVTEKLFQKVLDYVVKSYYM